MSCVPLHLIVGVLLVLNVVVENEAMTPNISMEPTSTPVSVPHVDTTSFIGALIDFTGNTSASQNSTDSLPSTTDEYTTSPEPDLPTPVSDHPQTRNGTTDDMSVRETTAGKELTTTRKPHTTPEPIKSYGSTYVIILVIIVVFITGITIYCCLQKKSRRYSVDLHPKQEDARIPLSPVDAEVFDSTSLKDMQTFSPVESSMPIKDPEPVKDANKLEGNKEAADVKQDHHENLSDTQAIVIPENKAMELTIVDLTDGEMAISTKTSMESLDDPLNENNHNNTRVKANDSGHEFTEICFDDLS